MIARWPCPLPWGGTSDEQAVVFDKARSRRLLILPALFDEANKTRRQIVEVMRRLDGSGIDCFLPDLAGWNESLQPLEDQTLESWRAAAQAAAAHFGATHCLTVRAGAMLVPQALPGWRYAPVGGTSAIRALLRARLISSREAGKEETTAGLQEEGRREGIELAGYRMGAALFAALEQAALANGGILRDIDQADIGGAGLWLRAEPDYDAAQADALAAIIAVGLAQ